MFNLLARTTAIDNVMLPMIYSGASDRSKHAREILIKMGLEDRLYHKPNELSGGQQQRVAISRALVNRPKILFADEPTGNLASDQAEDILNQLKLLNKSGISIIMVTHDPEIAAHAKRIVHIKDGVIVSDEPADNSIDPNETPPKDFFCKSDAASSKLSIGAGFFQLKEYGISAIKAIVSKKVRSLLSIIGILIGVAAVIAMLSLGNGAKKAVEASISNLGSNLLMIIPGSPVVGGVRSATGSVSRLTLEDVKAISGIPHALHAEGNAQGSAQVVYGDNNTNTQVTGATGLYAEMHNASPYYGRLFSKQEEESLGSVALLGQTVVSNLFGKENPIGKTVKINHINFKVIGVLPMRGSSGFRDQDDMVLVPLTTAMKRLLGTLYVNSIYVECDSGSNIPPLMSDIKNVMRKRHHLPDYKDDDFEIRNMADIQAALSGTTQTFTLLLGIVGAISLLVGGIGIMNIMLVSVSERTREIGLRKAIGAPRRAILIQFLMESIVLSVLGGVMGIFLGVSVSIGLSRFAGWAAIVTPHAVLLVFGFSAGVGVIFGFWPALKASLLSPIEALRYE
jgi:macrolide transport system ATP-binding/permease protein